MGRPKKAAAAQPVEPEEESQEIPDEEPQPTSLPEGAVNKAQAARAALDAGYEKPQQAVSYIKNTFGIEMTPTHFSAVKSQMKGKEESGAPKGKPGRKPKAASQAVEGYLAPPPKPKAAGSQPDLLAAMEAMKPLVDSLGKEQVKRIVDLLG